VPAAKSPFRLAAIVSRPGEIGAVLELANVKSFAREGSRRESSDIDRQTERSNEAFGKSDIEACRAVARPEAKAGSGCSRLAVSRRLSRHAFVPAHGDAAPWLQSQHHLLICASPA
jgi:hypothetical protein